MKYLTKVNKRSRRIKLQFCKYRGLIITSPRQLTQQYLNDICLEHQDWINTQLKKYPQQVEEEFPLKISLLCLDKEFQIERSKDDHNSLIQLNNTLKINSTDKIQAIHLLKKWLRNQAQEFYLERINYWSEKTQLNFKKLSVRSQKTRWGSCSSSGTISLNDQLMFMPNSILDYIIVHELCHTVQPNHSSKFWALVNTHYPNFKTQEQLLNSNTATIPKWFRASLYSH